MSPILPDGKMNAKQKNAEADLRSTTGLIRPKKANGGPLPIKRSHHKKVEPIISSLSKPPAQADPGPGPEVPAVPVNVETQKDPAVKSGGLVDLLKTAKARSEINAEPETDQAAKRSHHGPNESTGRPRGRPSKNANRDDYADLTYTALGIFVLVARVPEGLRPLEDELQSFSYSLAGIMSRHLPDISGQAPDLMDVIGMIATIRVYYQRVAPEIKRIQSENEKKSPALSPANPNGHKGQAVIEAGPSDPIKAIAPGVGEFLDHAHDKAGENG